MTIILMIIGLMSFTGLIIGLCGYIICENVTGGVITKTLKKAQILAGTTKKDIVRFDFYKSAEFGV
jgi:hypothetical protein